ncbi:asparaginase family protein [Cordyceps militaris CM01]|uniref:Asparaginase family protein n=1 Tax=Cordyceps militaris (strain CM01) TaxID=983644 RepID=G3J9Y8_CORMM|nr:asparaginase family protein [Cordyceps militaris CM01]EGX94211.1 asparaginase family protein [Cordyceps militaris CM01]
MAGCRQQVRLSTQPEICHIDGALDRVLGQKQRKRCIPAIFLHAGAGFHSHQNEDVHLRACVAAAEMGMRFLKAGASATEAVEASLRVLEDKEITNAGYGSNLSIDGTVECDATIVDHLGRSGACGAVPNIRNPISLAKLIFDGSKRPLSLRRVPPNALVGEGAKLFAEEHGMATFANDYLVSKNSRDRFLRWQDDLVRAEAKAKEASSAQKNTAAMHCAPCQYDTLPIKPNMSFPRDHAAAIMSGTWNEGQPNSPYLPPPGIDDAQQAELTTLGITPNAWNHTKNPSWKTPQHGINPSNKHSGLLKPTQGHVNDGENDDFGVRPKGSNLTGISSANDDAPWQQPRRRRKAQKRLLDGNYDSEDTLNKQQCVSEHGGDYVTDTIGAIAIDEEGLIAAGSSSGGIGMKHRGRLGPAALVGVGTAVVPCQPDDEDAVSVAAVTSGTGEHMATTMASQRCAERLYNSTRKGPAGTDIHDYDESAIMESFIANDFMGHPGVCNGPSAGAIGIMAVKKTRAGYYLQFAHNTDSFALASMGGKDPTPTCVMSRLPEGSKIAQGSRKISTK